MSAVESPRNKLIRQLALLLADKMVDVELDPDHYNVAIDIAIDRYRQKSDMGMEESHIFFRVQPEQQTYTLPNEVEDIRKLYRRGVGSNTSGGMNFDPFEAAFSNIYLLQAGRTGGLATWDLFAQYQETLSRVFASDLSFDWDRTSKKLTLHKRLTEEEDVLIQVYNRKPDVSLLTDTYTLPWLRDYSLAYCMLMLGNARGKFASGLPGPSGNITLNGPEMKQEASAMMEALEKQLETYATGRFGLPFIIA